MNIKKTSTWLVLLFTLLAGNLFSPALRAQNSFRPVESRYLFIFDTSSAMKKRLPGEVKTINEIFAVALSSQLHSGDSFGAWSFSQDLHTGEFPLERWQPQESSSIALDFIGFVKDQHYSKSTRFDQLMPVLNHVVRVSPRLTTIIFCDGDGQITGTPWDAKINGIFKAHERDMKKMRQPFIIILRSQFGQYVSSSVNTPDNLTLPQFPPLPLPPAPIATPRPLPPAPPPPLVIIDTPRQTNVPAVTPPPMAPAPAPAPPIATPPPANAAPQANPQTNVPPPMAVSTPPANAVASTPATAAPAAPASVAAPQANAAAPASTVSKGHLLALWAGIPIVAVVLAFVLFRPRHRASTSLITESLKKK